MQAAASIKLESWNFKMDWKVRTFNIKLTSKKAKKCKSQGGVVNILIGCSIEKALLASALLLAWCYILADNFSACRQRKTLREAEQMESVSNRKNIIAMLMLTIFMFVVNQKQLNCYSLVHFSV